MDKTPAIAIIVRRYRTPFTIVQSGDRATRTLKALSGGASERLGVSDPSTPLGLAKGAVYGLLQTLQVRGLVEQDSEISGYQLRSAALEMSTGYLDINELRPRAPA